MAVLFDHQLYFFRLLYINLDGFQFEWFSWVVIIDSIKSVICSFNCWCAVLAGRFGGSESWFLYGFVKAKQPHIGLFVKQTQQQHTSLLWLFWWAKVFESIRNTDRAGQILVTSPLFANLVRTSKFYENNPFVMQQCIQKFSFRRIFFVWVA